MKKSFLLAFSIWVFALPASVESKVLGTQRLNREILLAQQNWREISEALNLSLRALGADIGLKVVAQPRSAGHRVLFDMVATSQDLKKAILFSVNAKVSEHLEDTRFQFEDGVLIYQRLNGNQVGLFFFKFNEGEVDSVLSRLKRDHADQSKQFKGNRSIASETAPASAIGSVPTAEPMSELDILGDSFKACYVEGVPEGVHSATIKPFTMAWDSIKSFRYSPSKWWNRSVEDWNALVKRIEEFRVSEAFKGFASLPSREKSKVLCSFFGGAAGAGAATKVAQKAVVEVSEQTTRLAALARERAAKKPEVVRPSYEERLRKR